MSELGKLLQQTRKKRKYSLEQVNKLTRISQKYIKALEESDASVFPAEIYHKSFLKNYAKFLELDLNEVVKMYEQEKKGVQYELFSNDEISGQKNVSSDIEKNTEKKQNKNESADFDVDKGKKDIKRTTKAVFKKRNKKENTDVGIDIIYDIKNGTKQNLFIVKIFAVVIFCMLFVALLMIINISFKQKKSTQIKEEAEIVYNDNFFDDNKEEQETVSDDNFLKKQQTENKIISGETNSNDNKQNVEIVPENKKIDNSKTKDETVSSNKVSDTDKIKVEGIPSEKISDDNKQQRENLPIDTILEDNKEKVKTVSVEEISDNDKKIYSETKKKITKQSLEIKAKEDSWIMVFVDGDQTFTGVLLAGQQQKYFADNNFTIVMENIENLKVFFNGKPIDISVGAKEDKSNTLILKKDN